MAGERETERVRRLKVLHIIVLGLCAGVIVLSIVVFPLVSRVSSQARVACLRTKEFGPAVARFDAAHHVFTAAQLRDYRATIPKSCG